ncbi:hypothetical protein ILYODFUR_014909 [Ilyodon furcidens]|uniref:Uncharacterized protein n=1 Tax=Ilyodon furcidens TaxID=33524 RepID=A0ABV0TLP4_9TELE
MKVLERLLLAHLSKQTVNHQDLLQFIAVELELKMPSYTCFNKPTVIWTKPAALLLTLSPRPGSATLRTYRISTYGLRLET